MVDQKVIDIEAGLEYYENKLKGTEIAKWYFSPEAYNLCFNNN